MRNKIVSFPPGSILVWAVNANRAKKWSDINGLPILTQWHDAIVNNDRATIANQPVDALGDFYVVIACLRLAQPYINNCKCRQWMADSVTGFGAIVRGLALKTVSMPQANVYMIEQYYAFDRACGSTCIY